MSRRDLAFRGRTPRGPHQPSSPSTRSSFRPFVLTTAPFSPTKGPDLIEDSAGLGGTEGVVSILRGKDSSQKKEALAWLAAAFRKSPEAVLHEPDAVEIFLRIYRLVHLVSVAEGFCRPSYPHGPYWPCMQSIS